MKNVLFFLITILFLSNVRSQDPGDLDLTYGTNGISTIPFLYKNSVYDVSIMSDDRIITGGKYYNLGENNLLAFKFNTDGSLSGFNAGSWFEHSFAQYELISQTYVLPDDKILLTGTYNSTPRSIFLIQLTADGYLDPSFAVDGIYSAEMNFVPGKIDVSYGSGGDYSIYLSGRDDDFTYPSIMKFDSFGSPVSSFGTDGIYRFPLYEGGYYGLIIESSGGGEYIYACGYEVTGEHAYVSKHNINTGDLINTFGNNGCVVYQSPLENAITAHFVTNQNNNNTITVFGSYFFEDIDRDLYAIRLNVSDGSLDESFGVMGWSALRIAGGDEYVTDVIMQADGKYYFSAFTDVFGDRDFMLGRMLDNGYLDLDFGTNGIVVTDIVGVDEARGMGLNAMQDRIYVGGTSDAIGPDRAASIACYYTDFSVGIGNSYMKSFKQEINIYPNPARSHITLKTELYDNYLIEIFSPDGRLIVQESQENNSFQINIDHLNKGMYFLKLSGSNISQTSKIIKQ